MGGFKLVELFALLNNLGLGFVVGAFRILFALELAPKGLVALGLFALGTFALIVWLYAGLILGFRGVRFFVRLVSARSARRNCINRLFLTDRIIKRRSRWCCVRFGAGSVCFLHRLLLQRINPYFRSDLTRDHALASAD
jgi:hypothetical protein